MVEYITRMAPVKEGAVGSVYQRLNIDPQTGISNFQPGSVEHQRTYLPEIDPRLSFDDRAAARAARLAAEQAEMTAAVAELKQTGVPPAGFVVVRREDGTDSISIGGAAGAGFVVVRHEHLETVRSFGFAPAAYVAC